jgi:hypothetical protein
VGAWAIEVIAALAVAAGVCGMSGDGSEEGASRRTQASSNTSVAPIARYDRDIRPLFADHCFKCHGPDPSARRADLRLDQSESATAARDGETPIVPGHPDSSELWKRITSDDPDEMMPPPKSGKRALSAEERELVRAWIASGAAYEPHWSFVAPKRPAPPSVKNEAWCRNPIDRFVLARLEAEGIAPSPRADPETLVRRVFLDLTGLPPTPEELDAFAADDAKGDGLAYERMVDRLLGEEPYQSRTAERLATPWMDAARYADTCGIHTDDGRQMWAWRDWVLAAYRDNMPYDRFLTEQLAGDLLPDATVSQKIASGFNRNHVTTDEGGAIPEEYLVEYAVDRASTTASAFLGLTMGCARCHDHKFDPISNEEFYRFYAYFNSVEEPGLYTQTPDANRAYEPFMELPTPEQSEKLAGLRKDLDGLRELLAKVTPEEAREHAAFLEALPGEAGVSWMPTELASARSTVEGGPKLTPLGDGSVLASGPNPDADVHEFVVRASEPSADIRMVLLEALQVPSLGQGRVGRFENGNAVLSGVEVEAVTRDDPAKFRGVEVSWLWSDYAQDNGDYHFTNALLNTRNMDRGWAVGGQMLTGNRRLLLLLKEPIRADAGEDVRIRLRYESIHLKHALGRVRFTLGSIEHVEKLPVVFGNWRLVGPFPGESPEKVYDAAYGPETAASIDFAQNFGNGNQFWRFDANLRDGAVVPLAQGVNVTYVGRMIYAASARPLQLSLGSDDGFRLFVNGKEAASHQIDRTAAPDQDKATIQLQAGANVIVMKIVNTGGDSAYYFKALSPDDAYPTDLVAGLIPAEARAPESAERMRHAWNMSRNPQFRERQSRMDGMDRQVAEIQAKVPRTMVMKELPTPRPTFVLKRGQYDAPDKSHPVERGVPAALGTLPKGAPANRLGLARWMVSADNPLTARVAMNRLWEMVFGTGLVKTSEDFGQRGEWPSHPELLDWLAVEFREGSAGGAGGARWDVRRMLRLMVTSETYRQSSAVRAELKDRDPENRLLASYPRRRLGAEQIRDQALAVSGLLVEKFGGPSVKTYQPEGLWQEGALPASNTRIYERGKGEDLYRRSLYTYWKRAVPPPSMQAFDAPTREYCVVHRANTGTPLQALVLWNDPQFVEAARVLAERTLSHPGDDRERLTELFRRCTSRRPEDAEASALARALADWRTRYAAAPGDARKLLAVGDTPAPDTVDAAELASWTMLAGAVLDLYRTTTQE